MLEHMNFKSTKNLAEGEFDKIVKSIGGVDNAFTSFDYTQYFIKSTTKHLSQNLELFAEVMENLNLTDEEFQRERKVVYEERLWRTDNNPLGYLYFRLFNNAYNYRPYHWTPIGFKEDILNWDIKDIRKFHKTYYQPKNAIIVIAGDVEVDETFKLVEKKFSKIKNKTKIPKVHSKDPALDGDKRVIVHKESELEMVAIAYHIPNFEHKDMIKLSALSELLSSTNSSILNKRLIYEKQLVNQIYAYPMDNTDNGLFLCLAVCNPNIKAETVEKEIKKILKNYKITKKELQKLKLNTKMDFITSLESSDSVAQLFGRYFAKGNIKPLLEYEEKINSLNIKDLMDMKKYFDKNITVILRNK